MRAAAAHGARRRNRPASATPHANSKAAASDHDRSSNNNNNSSTTISSSPSSSGAWRVGRISSSGGTSADSGCRDSDESELDDDASGGRNPGYGRGSAFGRPTAAAPSPADEGLGWYDADFLVGESASGHGERIGEREGQNGDSREAAHASPAETADDALSDAEWLGEAMQFGDACDLDDLLDLSRNGRQHFLTSLSSSGSTGTPGSGGTGTPTSVAVSAPFFAARSHVVASSFVAFAAAAPRIARVYSAYPFTRKHAKISMNDGESIYFLTTRARPHRAAQVSRLEVARERAGEARTAVLARRCGELARRRHLVHVHKGGSGVFQELWCMFR